MHDLIEQYGKVILALAAILAAILLTIAVITIVSNKTTDSVNSIEYQSQVESAIQAPTTTP